MSIPTERHATFFNTHFWTLAKINFTWLTETFACILGSIKVFVSLIFADYLSKFGLQSGCLSILRTSPLIVQRSRQIPESCHETHSWFELVAGQELGGG